MSNAITHLARRPAKWRMAGVAIMLALVAGCSSSDSDEPGASAASDQHAASDRVAVARGKIDVDGGIVELAAVEDGVVSAVAVQPGTRVKRGQLLLQQNDSALAGQLSVSDGQRTLARAQQTAAQREFTALRSKASRYEQAAQAGAADGNELSDIRQQLASAQSDVAIATARVKLADSEYQQTLNRRALLAIKAPDDGTVVSVATQRGAYLHQGATALMLMPARPLIVRAEVGAAYIDKIKPGARATVVSDMDGADGPALPEAHVTHISPVYGSSTLSNNNQVGEVRVVQCILAFDGDAQALVGQNVRVTFHDS
ncbi:HlyD family secretion protein [Carnimonas bestiolae]|uniref:HlyD family secretion protein n=1 Tax=Carnimonas bestiolae TaxID=3402172 RepID=UPI003EDC4D28